MFENTGPAQAGRCRILYVVGQMHTGGLERQLVYLLRGIDRDRYRPAVAVWQYNEQDIRVPDVRSLGVPLYAMSGPASGLSKMRAFRALAKHLGPEVVHSYTFFTNVAAAWAASSTAAVAIGSIRSDFLWGKRDAGPVLGRLSARWPRYQISNSFSAAEAAHHSHSVFTPATCGVVFNGLDLELFRPSALPAGTPRIVGLGYLLPVKRWDRLVAVAAALKRDGVQCHVDIVGDGTLRDDLVERTRRADVVDRVHFLSHTNDVPAALSRASLLVLPSDNEGTPNVVMEAMACGRAVVACGVGDIPKLVDDGTTGYIVKPGDDAMLAERIAALVRDPDLCRQMGEAGRRKAEREFGLQRLGRETLAFYRDAGWREQQSGTFRMQHVVGE